MELFVCYGHPSTMSDGFLNVASASILEPFTPNRAATTEVLVGFEENISHRLEQLSGRLVSLTRRNKSIRLLKKAKKQCYDLAEGERFKPGVAIKALKSVLGGRGATVLSQVDAPIDPRDARYELFIDDEENLEEVETEDYQLVKLFQRLESNLTQLSRNANLIESETGAMDLYLGYPFISGVCNDTEATFLQAPLILFPVQLKVQRRPRLEWEITARPGAEPVFNEALRLAFEQYHETSLSDEFEVAAEEFADSSEVRQSPLELIDWFHERLESMNFRMAPPVRGLQPLPEYKKADVPKAAHGFSINNNVVAGYFPQAGSALRLDYERLSDRAAAGDIPPVLAQLLDSAAPAVDGDGAREEDLTMDIVSEEETCWVMPTDASQETAMLRSRKEPCMVVHGPPGTGKSQVIVNMITDSLAKGERVLLCCQKRAALDVVYQRLESLGLASHVALVHDYSNDRKELYQHIARALEEGSDEGRAIHLNYEAEKLARSIDETTQRLKHIAHVLHDRLECGHSPRELYTHAATIERDYDEQILKAAPRLNRDELDRMLERLRIVQAAHKKIGRHLRRWSARKSFASLTFVEEKRIRAALAQLEQAASDLSAAQEPIAGLSPTLEALSGDLAHLEKLALLDADGEQTDLKEAVEALFIAQADGSKTLQAVETLKRVAPMLAELPPKPGRNENTPSPEECVALENYNAKRRSWFRFLSGRYRRAKGVSQDYLQREGLPDDADTVAREAQRGRSAQHWGKLSGLIEGTPLQYLLTDASAGTDLMERSRLLSEAGEVASTAWSEASSLTPTRSAFRVLVENKGSGFDAHVAAAKSLMSVHGTLDGVQRALDELSPFIKPEAVDRWLAVAVEDGRRLAELTGKLTESLGEFDAIQAVDSQIEHLGDLGQNILSYLQKKEVADDWAGVVEDSVVLGWLHVVEKTHTELREVSSGDTALLRDQFRKQLERRRELNQLRLALELAQKATTPQFEPGRHVDGRHSAEKPWRDLKHQVNKKRRLWPLRRMIHELSWPLMEIMPCWLVSPETLSASFPLDNDHFDVVIFDEASQCAVQHGVPAMYRAKRIVIAGDEQQLRPFDLFGALGSQDDDGEEDDESDAAAVEAESILTLAKARFPQEMLKCHYRSRYEELIDFSNHGFYEGRLLTVPPADKGFGPPMEWHKVDGLWENRRNQIEAKTVMEVLYDRIQEYGPDKSFGVITFNNTQRAEILNQIDRRMLEDPEFEVILSRAFNPESGDRDASLFVKNIENVQGDERDIILFSIGYGPPVPGGRVRSSFGTLNKEGGDNRLNVAVSRAKERIIVVSSIEPTDLNVATAKNRGPRLLRDYLSYTKAVSQSNEDLKKGVLREINTALDVAPGGSDVFDSPFEEEVARELQKRGLEVHTQIGVSGYRIDLGVVDPEEQSRYLLGIECDGASYHSARSVRERDAYRQRFLESRGWTIHRIWSRNWWRRKDDEVRKVVELAAKIRVTRDRSGDLNPRVDAGQDQENSSSN